MTKYVFLLVSLLSGLVELGAIFYGISLNLDIIFILGLGLAYQIGNFIPNPLQINKIFTIVISILSVALLGITALLGFNYFIYFFGYICLAGAIQSIRSIDKSNINTSVKRIFRVIGFLLSPFSSPILIVIIAFIILSVCLFSVWKTNKIKLIKPRLNFLNTTMTLHQIHYFNYSYIILISIYNLFKIPNIFIASFFVLGWLSYISVPHLLRKDKYYAYAIGGHLFLSVILILLALSIRDYLSVFFWILTGFGGGTVFCFKKIDKLTNRNTDFTFSENIGHILGIMISMFIIYIFKNESVAIYISSFFAFLTMIFLFIDKKTNYKDINNEQA